MTATSDHDLVLQTRTGDASAYAELVTRHQAAVCATALAVVHDISLSEDVGQEAFVEGWRKLDKLREPAKVGAWLCSIARAEGLKLLRKRKPTTPIDDHALGGTESAEEVLGRKENAALVDRVLDTIPESCRVALVLFYREDQSLKEVARILGVSEEAARQRVSRGRQAMREQLERVVGRAVARSRPGSSFALGVMASIRELGATPSSPTISPPAIGAGLAGYAAPLVASLWFRVGAIVVLIALCALAIAWPYVSDAQAERVREPTRASKTEIHRVDERQRSSLTGPAPHAPRDNASGTSRDGDPSPVGLPTAPLRGRVLIKGSNTPCIHADVSVFRPERTFVSRIAYALTDARGTFAIDGLQPGEYSVAVTCREHGSAEEPRVGYRKVDVALPSATRDWLIDLPPDWVPLLSESIDEAPPSIARQLRDGDTSRVRAEDEMREEVARAMDTDGDGKVSEAEQRAHEEALSHMIAPTEGYANGDEKGETQFYLQEEKRATIEVPTTGHLSEGNSEAAVTIINITNFGSPFCVKTQAILKRLREDYPDELHVVTRVQRGVADSALADKAYCAAARQGGAAAFMESVWSEATVGRDFSEENMLRIAERIGLEHKRFLRDMLGKSCAQQIEKNEAELIELGLRGTPTWVINGQVLVGARNIDSYREVIEKELAQRRQRLSLGHPR